MLYSHFDNKGGHLTDKQNQMFELAFFLVTNFRVIELGKGVFAAYNKC